MRVLIVDDDHMSCKCLEQLIDWDAIGCESPRCAHNGAEALRCIAQERPDIVVSDVKMPVMDGRELCRQIYESYPEISLFFVSAYEDFQTAQLAIRYNVKGYVLKPLDRDTVYALQEMIRETVLLQESTSFYQKICDDGYRDVLKRAIEEKDREMVERIFRRAAQLQGKPGVKEISLWQHLITPLIDYKNTSLKMDYGMLFEAERRMQKQIMECAPEKRSGWLLWRYQEAMEQERPEGSPVVLEMQKVIRERFSSPDLDVNMLAGAFDMSPVYLGRLFLEQTGMKVTDYIQEKRLRFACDELQNGVKSVKEIAMLAGWRDAGYFNKVFRRSMGMTPGEYRERHWRQSVQKEGQEKL